MGLKYICEYRTLNTNELWKVEIHLPSYSGDPIDKTGVAGQTCIIDWAGGDKLLDKFAIGSSASISLLFDDEADVNELQNISDKSAIVKVYNNDAADLYWQGYIISDGVQHPDSGVIFPIQLTAVDMIDAANEIEFINTDVGAITIDGVVGSDKSPLNWIRKCLAYSSNMANDMPIRWSCSVKNSQYPTDDFFGGRTSLIYNYEEFQASRQETFVGWILENIVKSVSCLLFQNGGYWYIVSLKDLAVSSTLTFNQITAGLEAKTATSLSIDLNKVLPNKLNESTYSMVQKPISKVKSTYNHSMQTNIIPNGGFDIVESGKPLYWEPSSEDISIISNSPINLRKTGYAARFNNSGSDTGFATFEALGLNSMPLDANVLFKHIQWGFTFMPVNFPTDADDFIDWSSEPLQIIVSYTGYNGGELQKFFLNKFGYWQGQTIDFDALRITSVDNDETNTGFFVYFTGDAYTNQYYRLNYVMDGVTYSFQVDFLTPLSLTDAVQKIADETGGYYNVGDYVSYEFSSPVTGFSASVFDPIGGQLKIGFEVDEMKNMDVATVQFQSKGNQGNVLLPNPGVLDQMRALESGKLELLLVLKSGQEIVFDDLYMNVSSDKEYWNISDGGTDGKEEYELDISSSFSGFMSSSYMNNFAVSDLSMIMGNGIDTGTLTEIFGKTALRMLSNPTKKIDTDLEGSISLLNLLEYNGGKYMPLKASVNTETNESKLTIFELKYDEDLVLTSVHKSTADGENNSSVGGNGSGGGGSSTSLATLSDVSLSTLTNDQVLTYNSTTGKWENKSGAGVAAASKAEVLAGTITNKYVSPFSLDVGFGASQMVRRDGIGAVPFGSGGSSGRIYGTTNKDVVISANESVSLDNGGVLIQTRGVTRLQAKVTGEIAINDLEATLADIGNATIDNADITDANITTATVTTLEATSVMKIPIKNSSGTVTGVAEIYIEV